MRCGSSSAPLALAIDDVADDKAISLNNLGLLYGAQGRYAEAEALYKRSLAIRQRALGDRHPDFAAALNVAL